MLDFDEMAWDTEAIQKNLNRHQMCQISRQIKSRYLNCWEGAIYSTAKLYYFRCPMCGNVFGRSEWVPHKAHELKRRKGLKKPDFKLADGTYRCVVPACEYSTAGHYNTFKRHLMSHTEQELRTSPIPWR